MLCFAAKHTEITGTYTTAPSFQCNTYYSVTYIKIKYLLITSLLLEDRDCIIFICVLPQHLGGALLTLGTQCGKLTRKSTEVQILMFISTMYLMFNNKRETQTIALLKNQITTENLLLALYSNYNHEALRAGND